MGYSGLTAYTDERSLTDEKQILTLVTKRFDISKAYRESFDDKFEKPIVITAPIVSLTLNTGIAISYSYHTSFQS